MSERAQVLGATLAGAAIGGLIGYLYFTASGRRLRGEIEPRLTEVSREIVRVRDTMVKAYAAFDDGRRSLERLAADPARWPVYDTPSEQDVPFV
ncbi:MAG: YtxH domain-containing protein [Acidobacteria bacterium]|nr:YtxH domain-containing protein [Acidobacteriota bacterium]